MAGPHLIQEVLQHVRVPAHVLAADVAVAQVGPQAEEGRDHEEQHARGLRPRIAASEAAGGKIPVDRLGHAHGSSARSSIRKISPLKLGSLVERPTELRPIIASSGREA